VWAHSQRDSAALKIILVSLDERWYLPVAENFGCRFSLPARHFYIIPAKSLFNYRERTGRFDALALINSRASTISSAWKNDYWAVVLRSLINMRFTKTPFIYLNV